jgi:hypothetical protein
VIKYLGRHQVANMLGVKPDTLGRYKLPPPDAVIGEGPKQRRGWLPGTIRKWNADRPGSVSTQLRGRQRKVPLPKSVDELPKVLY